MVSKKAIQILLVEDSPIHAELIGTALAAWDRHVDLIVARTLAEARARLTESHPDLMIVDLMLPDGQGVELLPPRTGGHNHSHPDYDLPWKRMGGG